MSVPGLPNRAYQLQYVSTDTDGDKQANVATVIIPLHPSTPPRLVSYETPIDSLSYNCDASYKLRTGREPDVVEVGSLLALGWTVIVPDFLGPDHQWTAGYVEAHGTLDGIRAAENFAPTGLAGAGTSVGLTGYSGGARGAEFANELASRYAPELTIVGAAPGGLAVDVRDVMRHINGGLFAGVYFAAFFGLGRAYPSIGVDQLLNARGQ